LHLQCGHGLLSLRQKGPTCLPPHRRHPHVHLPLLRRRCRTSLAHHRHPGRGTLLPPRSIIALLAFVIASAFNSPMSLIEPPTRRAPRHPRYDAIHRALLTGLLSHVGTKTETHEYAGTRGTRFHVFPGSSLFGQRQKWIVAGEIVETSKLYARNCAAVEVAW